jgi:lipoyl(octanoyl) transferase
VQIEFSAEWRFSQEPQDYLQAVQDQENRVAAIHQGTAPELVWFLEHPPLYTAGTSAKEKDLLKPSALPVYQTGRGGQYTYHGPGQRIVYLLCDLKKRTPDIRRYVHSLEECLIESLAEMAIKGERRDNRIGIWVTDHKGTEKKIAALGIRVKHWITYHGIALNVHPNLRHYEGIIPCGLENYGVTSLQELNCSLSMENIDEILRFYFSKYFFTISS